MQFLLPGVIRLFERIDPLFVTYEFTYRDLDEWLSKIRCQRRAMAGVHLSQSADPLKESIRKSEAVL